MNAKRPFQVNGLEMPDRFPSPDEIERHLVRSRQLRAEATLGVLAAARRALAPLLRTGGTPPSRWWREMRLRRDAAGRARSEEQRLYRELAAYDDRELDDLGVRRADIRAIVRGREPVPAFE